jgi:HlyD family secretion protein
MKRASTAAAIGLATVLVIGAYERVHGRQPRPTFQHAAVTLGDVVRRVAATGTLEAVTTVEVGSQVSGTISYLGADFNSIVHRGQVVARLDPALLDAQIESARSELAKSEGDLQAAGVAVDDANRKLSQVRALHDRQLETDEDLDAAAVTFKTALAARDSATALVAQARAVLDQALVSRQHTDIASPIDGIVIGRNVDIGQTVAASLQAPTLFVIANDLRRMQLNAAIDESDIGAVHVDQPVTFTVDAYPQEEFSGMVSEIRLQPTVVQNVVSYATIVAVDNRDLQLKPGMTATLNIEVARARDVSRVAVAALRFVPRETAFAALGEEIPRAYWDDVRTRPAGGAPGAKGIVWTDDPAGLHAVPVAIGLSDGSVAEVSGQGVARALPVVIGETGRSFGLAGR